MIIRAATQLDKPGIIQLLKQSLGESLIPITEKLWSWKHEENPFGPSFILLAEEDNQVVGVRAFMQWTWQWKNETYRAIRAVDTATHPQHQGKGIFKKLTLQQIDKCKQEGIHFVFNTPNNQSMPGYLKMGWEKQGRMNLKIKLVRPVSLAYAKFFNPKKHLTHEDRTPVQEWPVVDLFKSYQPLQNYLTTAVTREYILWRYARNPLFRYNYFTDHKNYVLISRIKTHSFSNELRLVDFILLSPGEHNHKISSHLKKAVSRFCRDNGIDFISFSGRQYQLYRPYFKWMGLIPVRPLGPIITLKNVNMENRFPELLDAENWNYSLGDMELF